MSVGLMRLLQRAVDVRADEVRALLLSFAYFFFLLAGYYVLRPVRDEMGVAGGVRNLQWLFTGTFMVMLAVIPVFGWLSSRYARRRMVPIAYHFFALCIVGFFVAFQFDAIKVHTARAFFIWVSVYNLFVVSVFWSLMADLFANEQGKRLFGFIAAGGTVGALTGPGLTAALAVPLGPINLLLISALFLEAAVFCVRRLTAEPPHARPEAPAPSDDDTGGEALGGGIWAGVTELARSPYLLGVGLYIVLHSLTGTFVYFEQAHIVAGAFESAAERTQVFALIDLAVNVATLLIQISITGRLMRGLGVGPVLAILPLVATAGFLALAALPTLAVLIAFQVTRRAANYAVSRPAREVLYTVVPREQKYKVKNVIDTVVYRGGDAFSGWVYTGLRGSGLDVGSIALVAAPIAAAWLVLGLALGRGQDRMATKMATGDAKGEAL